MSSTPRTFDPTSMALRGRIGAYVQKSRHDPRELTKAGRAAFLAKFEEQVDPERKLPEAERKRRAEAAHRAHMISLSFKSAEARRQRNKSKKRT